MASSCGQPIILGFDFFFSFVLVIGVLKFNLKGVSLDFLVFWMELIWAQSCCCWVLVIFSTIGSSLKELGTGSWTYGILFEVYKLRSPLRMQVAQTPWKWVLIIGLLGFISKQLSLILLVILM